MSQACSPNTFMGLKHVRLFHLYIYDTTKTKKLSKPDTFKPAKAGLVQAPPFSSFPKDLLCWLQVQPAYELTKSKHKLLLRGNGSQMNDPAENLRQIGDGSAGADKPAITVVNQSFCIVSSKRSHELLPSLCIPLQDTLKRLILSDSTAPRSAMPVANQTSFHQSSWQQKSSTWHGGHMVPPLALSLLGNSGGFQTALTQKTNVQRL